jgi:hypothetical protein
MATKLRVVSKDEVRKRQPRQLVAAQVFTFMTSDGGPAFGMVDREGVIYMLSATGWLACNMMEAPDNDSTL